MTDKLKPGRPAGSIGKKNEHVRKIHVTFRATEGLNETFKVLIKNKLYKSKSDIVHEAVQKLAYQKLTGNDIYWANQIF
jgi:Arc/MetJ-type ribon-helix-helix transcriptional regulator